MKFVKGRMSNSMNMFLVSNATGTQMAHKLPVVAILQSDALGGLKQKSDNFHVNHGCFEVQATIMRGGEA